MNVEKINSWTLRQTPLTAFDSEEVSALDLVTKVATKTDEVVDALNKKIGQGDNFEGSWWGIPRPVYAEPGIAGVVAKNTDDIDSLTSQLTARAKDIIKAFDVKNDGTDTTTKFLDATAEDGRLFLPAGTYKISSIAINKNIIFIGAGKGKTIIKCGHIDVYGKCIFEGITFMNDESVILSDMADNNTSSTESTTLQVGIPSYNPLGTKSPGIEVYNCEFDFVAPNPTHYGFAVRCHNTKKFIMTNCNIYKAGVELRYTENYIIKENSFDMQSMPGQSEAIHSSMDCSGVILYNTFINCLQDAIDLYPTSHDVLIEGNKFLNTPSSALCITIKAHFRDNDDNGATNYRNAHLRNIIVTHNFFNVTKAVGAVIDATVYDERTDRTADMSKYYMENIKIAENIFSYDNSLVADSGQNYTIVQTNGGIRGLDFSDNLISSCKSVKIILNMFIAGYSTYYTNGYDYTIKNNICKIGTDFNSTQPYALYQLSYLDGLLFDKNINYMGANKQNITSSCFAITNCTNAMIEDNQVVGTAYSSPTVYDYYVRTTSGNHLDSSICTDGFTTPEIYAGRVNGLTGGYVIKDNEVYLSMQFTTGYGILDGGSEASFVKVPRMRSDLKIPISAYNLTTHKPVGCMLIYDSASNTTWIQMSGAMNVNDVIIIKDSYLTSFK
jgi:hypothetical protein